MEKIDNETTTGEKMKIQMGRRQGKAVALGILVLALVVGACGGGGDDEQRKSLGDKLHFKNKLSFVDDQYEKQAPASSVVLPYEQKFLVGIDS